MTESSHLADAYARCEAITRAQAANFFYGIRLLSGERRRAMCAVYAFARRIDDIGDGTLAAQDKLDGLAREQQALASLGSPGARTTPATDTTPGADPVIVALGDAYARFAIPPDALNALVEGVRMDVEGTTYETFDELVVYCRCVAGAIGRACLAIFGLRDADADADTAQRARAEAMADDLGVALQLTNILRDVREDAQNGRVYLPAEDLDRFQLLAPDADTAAAPAFLAVLDRAAAGSAGSAAGAPAIDGVNAGDADRVAALVRFESARAGDWFERGIALTDMLDRRSTACVLAMAGIYRRLLTRIERNALEPARGRVSLPASEKAWVAARGLLGVGV
jgi:15-cis-phytoene synthase